MTPLDAEVLSRLHDVADRCLRIAQYLGDATYAEFDAKTRAAVERELITIGEAVGAALRRSSAIDHAIPDAREIVDLRNVLVHGYRRLDAAVIWTIATTQVPELERRVRAILSGHPPAGPSSA